MLKLITSISNENSIKVFQNSGRIKFWKVCMGVF